MENQFFQKPNTFVGNVELKVQDLLRSVKFYTEVIGFQVLRKSKGRAVLSVDGETALLTIIQPNHVEPKQENTSGLYHFAILLPNRLDLAKVLKHFIQLNEPLGASDHLVSEALYLNDPDGNGIEIYTDRPSSTWGWKKNEVTMAVDPLDGNDLLAELKGERWDGLPTGTVIGHIHLHVSHLPETEEFYIQGLGFNVVSRFGKQAIFISTGGYHHHIALNTWAGVGAPVPNERSVGLESFSLVYPDEQARKDAVERLEGLDYPVQKEGGFFITRDPSQNLIKLVV